jgi:hypothetical protein
VGSEALSFRSTENVPGSSFRLLCTPMVIIEVPNCTGFAAKRDEIIRMNANAEIVRMEESLNVTANANRYLPTGMIRAGI